MTKADYSTLFYFNLAASIVIYLFLYAVAPFVAEFYARPELCGIIRVISITILIHALRIVQRVIIFRSLDFRFYTLVCFISGLISLGVAMFMAREGYGYKALVWQQIVMAACQTILLQAKNRFIPSLTFSRSSFSYQFSFGINLIGSDAIRTVANNISANIIGKISSLQFTGFYTQSSKITNFCQSSLGALMDQTVFPILAKEESLEKVARAYRKLLIWLTLALLAVTVIMLVFGEQIVRLVLGDEWTGATDIFRILTLTIVPASIQVLCRNIIKTLGNTKAVLRLETLKSAIILILLLPAAIPGSYWVVWALVAGQAISCIVWMAGTEKELKKQRSRNQSAPL